MAITWKDGDVITADKLNGMQLQFSATDIKTDDATDLPEGALTIDVNGDIYQSKGGKQALLTSLKGADGKDGAPGAKGADGATGPAGKDGKDGAVGPAGKDGLSVKSGTLNEDKNGALTGGTLTMSDNSTVPLTINKATA